MPNVIPLNAGNAIKSAAFAIEFTDSVPPEVVHNLIAFHKQDAGMRSTYPRVQPIEVMSFQVGLPGMTSTSSSLKTLGGVTFDRLMPDGTQELAITLRPDALIFNCSNYDNWEAVSGLAIDTLENVSNVCNVLKVKSIGLEYLDIFKVNDMSKKGWVRELFNADSEFLPKYLFDSIGFWHVHQGFFSQSEDERYEMLNNIMIDCMPGGESNVVQMRSQHKVNSLINQNLSSLFEESQVRNIFNCEHDSTSKFMRGLLSEEMLKAIGMKP